MAYAEKTGERQMTDKPKPFGLCTSKYSAVQNLHAYIFPGATVFMICPFSPLCLPKLAACGPILKIDVLL